MARRHEPKDISLAETRRLIDSGAQLVEALPADEFEEEHLPGAISIPLKEFTSARTKELDPGRPVVVYCWDDT